MNFGKINVISPPDNLFNLNTSYLLIKPSTQVKMQFQQILSSFEEDINVFIYDTDEEEIEWMLSVSHHADIIIIDIDNCDETTKMFISFLLVLPNVFYITEDEITPWHLLSRNRINNLDFIASNIQEDDEDYDDDE